MLDLCLSCKACKSECPSSVDMAKLKAEFMQHYQDINGVPLRSRVVAGFVDGARLASIWPTAYNALFQTATIRKAFNRMVGFHPQRSLPVLNRTTLRRWFQRRRPSAPLRDRLGRVHFFCDEFTNYNDLSAGIAAIELLELIGYEVVLLSHPESGRAAISKGLLRRAKKFAESNVGIFAPVVTDDEPLVGVEPSAILGFRDEYPALVKPALRDAARALASRAFMIDEFIAREADRGKIPLDLFTKEKRTIHLHGHCHQKALASLDPTVRMLSLPCNYTVKTIPSGCCGMAGSFGYETEHYEVSMAIGELVLLPAVRAVDEKEWIAAPGTSCRHQIHDGTGRVARHPVEILRQALHK